MTVLLTAWSQGPAVPGPTWEYDGTGWFARTPAASPPARSGHALAYDSARGKVVLFGLPREASVTLERYAGDVIFGGVTLKGIIGRKLYDTWERTQDLLRSGALNVAPIETWAFRIIHVAGGLAVGVLFFAAPGEWPQAVVGIPAGIRVARVGMTDQQEPHGVAIRAGRGVEARPRSSFPVVPGSTFAKPAASA